MTVRKQQASRDQRGTILLMIVGLLSMLFLILSAYITLARFDRVNFGQTQKNAQTDRILGSVLQVALAAMRDQLADSEGVVLGDGSGNPNYSYEDIPGFRGSSFLAANEPVRRDAIPGNPNIANVIDVRFPGVTQFSRPTVVLNDATGNPKVMPAPRTVELAYDFANQGIGVGNGYRPSFIADRNAPQNILFGNGRMDQFDLLDLAFSPYMDADGDGVIDSYFPAMALVTELANVHVGSPVRVPGSFDFDTNTINLLTGIPVLNAEAAALNRALLEQFDANARYSVAVKVVSHGGMVPIVRGNDPSALFAAMMFSWLRDPADPASILYVGVPSMADQLAGEATAVEPLLRRRNLLPAFRGSYRNVNAQYAPRTPRSMRWFEDTFKNTLLGPQTPAGTSGGADRAQPSQRYDVASMIDLANWQRAMFLSASTWNLAAYAGAGNQPSGALNAISQSMRYYDKRHQLTTISSSDEFARVQEARSLAASFGALRMADQQVQLGLPAGAPKFFLGEIEKCFDASGNFMPAVGNVLIPRLASYFYDMLGGHEWGANAYTAPSWSGGVAGTSPEKGTVVSRRQQAFMLAVNTVAFAAPIQANGVIDVVAYSDAVGDLMPVAGQVATTPQTYVGYAPQPVLSQVIAYGEDSDTQSGVQASEVSIGVELFNPSDPGGIAGADPFALAMDQFAITFNDGAVANQYYVVSGVSPGLRLDGRNFMTLGFTTTSNTYFRTFSPPAGTVHINRAYPGVGELPSNPGFFDVHLWRLQGGATPTWFKVDTMRVPYPNPGTLTSDHTTLAYRDMSSEPYFGNPTSAGFPAWQQPRWRCLVAFDPSDAEYTPSIIGASAGIGHSGDPSLDVVNLGDPANSNFPGALPVVTPRQSPTVPMLTTNVSLSLNGALTSPILNGVRRPRAFPTVGFMHLVPRYSHTATAPVTPVGQHPMTQWLREDWKLKNYSAGRWPVDFGHMPVFDNKQPARDDRYFDDKKGVDQVPWGQLVFDYFSTRNVSDPYAGNALAHPYYGAGYAFENPADIRGRININTASWWTLAGLPTIVGGTFANPTIPGTPGLAAVGVSPALTNAGHGMLFGVHSVPLTTAFVNVFGVSGTRRFDDQWRLMNPTAQTSPANLAAAQWVWRLGPLLGQAAAAYRDRLPYSHDDANVGVSTTFPDSGIPYVWTRDNPVLLPVQALSQGVPVTGDWSFRFPSSDMIAGAGSTRLYGDSPRRGTGDTGVTSSTPNDATTQYGFVSVGELLNVIGLANDRDPVSVYRATGASPGALIYGSTGQLQWPLAAGNGDYLKAVSYLMLLDTHFLTTRSNTFTVYVSLMANDPEQQEQSLRAQYTVDRANILPQPAYAAYQPPGSGVILPRIVSIQQTREKPRVLVDREIGYYNTQFDE